jgi:cyclic di-GMP phosphodiesterase Gmr
MNSEIGDSILYSRFGTATPIWSLPADREKLILRAAPDEPATEIDLLPESAARIRALTGCTSSVCIQTEAFGRRGTLHLVGKRVSEIAWAGTAAELDDSEAVARNLSGALAFAEQVVSEANAVVVIINQEGRIQRFNRLAEEYVGMKEEDLIGRSAWDLFMLGTEKEASQANISGFFKTGQSYEVERVINTRKGLRVFLFRNKFALSVGWTKERYMICSGIDITEQRRAQERLSLIANTDALTGLPNRFFMTELLKQEFENPDARDRLAILYIDLNNFKEINDTIGHKGGDQLIRKVANRLQGRLGEGEQAMRIGGDEFVILIRGEQAAMRATEVARMLIREFDVVFVLGGVSYPVSVSIGIARFSGEDGSELDILTRADQAMYAAKNIAKAAASSHFCVHTPELAGRADRDLEFYQSLQLALVKGNLDVSYTPVYDARSHTQTALRARLVWHRNAMCQMTCDDFMLQADSSGLGVQVGEQMLDAVCRQLHEHGDSTSASVTVNVTASQLLQGDVAGCLRQWRDTYALYASRIRVIISGALLSCPTPELEKKLAAIRVVGAKVITQIGATTPFPNFLNLTVDGVAITADLLACVTSDRFAAASLKGLLLVCQELALSALVSGVDTEEQAEWLRQFPTAEVEGRFFRDTPRLLTVLSDGRSHDIVS